MIGAVKHGFVANRILEALPAGDQDRIVDTMVPVSLQIDTVLFEPGQPIDAVHFPLAGVIALVVPFDDGLTVEVATVGNEGVVGVPLVAGGSLAVRAISAVSGAALRMEAAAFVEELELPGPLRELVDTYTRALFGQISQAVACNRLHSNEQRLSRWLLMSHDRVGVDEFAMTHELLGRILGSSGPTATLTVSILEAAGLIRDRDGRVTIVNRPALEAVSCECYGVIKGRLDSVVQGWPSRSLTRTVPAPTPPNGAITSPG
jgi:CRP-like cAMP-binding protein